ncbi:3-oxoacyl-[acyl-carrier-protein] synthase, KASI [hydrothermal vent metagenome]|uniref:3-oxoacyl-[acyl-carrier-protein] synthase 1 n=1 Tax=hydrothermal vent metagenome TaxID=652676 RepID=A0A3B0Y673_9ZZZZ
MRRVVITGMGITSSIGTSQQQVLESLQQGKSGIVFAPEYAERGFRSHIHGAVDIDLDGLINRKLRRFMGDSAAYNYLAMKDAIEDSGLEEEQISNPRTGLIAGSGGTSTSNVALALDLLKEKGARKVGPFMVPRTMGSSNSACLSTAYKIKGVNYSISSACSTSAHCIGNGCELIQMGKQDIVFAGGGEELHWSLTLLFDAMGALSSKYNDAPETASRAYDESRDGFVIAGGGGMLVLEELEHAKARDAKIYAEVIGYGATSDGSDMVQPSGEGAVRCMRQAMGDNDIAIDYINAHGTSTPVGDMRELEAIKEVFADNIPAISSTKSLTGHSLGAAGVQEAIYSLLMLENDFICASANIQQIDPVAKDFPIQRERKDNAGLRTVMSNSFGFGGTNASLIMQKLEN